MQFMLTNLSRRRQAVALIALCLSFQAGLPQNSRDLLPVQVNHKYGFIDSTGKIVIPVEYDFAWGFAGGLAPAWKGQQAGYIDRSGKFVIPAQFEYARGFSQGPAKPSSANSRLPSIPLSRLLRRQSVCLAPQGRSLLQKLSSSIAMQHFVLTAVF